MRRSRLAAALGGAALALTALAVATPTTASAAPAAPAAPSACPPGSSPGTGVSRGPSGKIVRIPICRPGRATTTPTRPGDGSSGGGSGDNDGNYTICTPWAEAYPGHDPASMTPGGPGEEAYLCIRHINGAPVFGPYLPTWLAPGEEPPPSPAEVAADLLAVVEGELLDPDPVGYPAIGVAAVYDIPTFVSVANWQGEITQEDCDDATGTVCVQLTATPALTFDPGDGSEPIACEPGGTVYDPARGTPREQAEAEGACAHPYTRRTGTADRPDTWTAELTITWTVTWQQTAGGTEEGVLPDITTGSTFERVVEEVQSVGRESGG